MSAWSLRSKGTSRARAVVAARRHLARRVRLRVWRRRAVLPEERGNPGARVRGIEGARRHLVHRNRLPLIGDEGLDPDSEPSLGTQR